MRDCQKTRRVPKLVSPHRVFKCAVRSPRSLQSRRTFADHSSHLDQKASRTSPGFSLCRSASVYDPFLSRCTVFTVAGPRSTGSKIETTARRRGRWSSERTTERYVQGGAYCLQSLQLPADAKEKVEKLAELGHSSSQKYCQTLHVTHQQPQLPLRTKRRGRGGSPLSLTVEPLRTIWRKMPTSSILEHREVMKKMFADTNTDHATVRKSHTVSTHLAGATRQTLTRWCAEMFGCFFT